MADDDKGETAEGGRAVIMRDDGLEWSCRMTEVQRIEVTQKTMIR